jgi:hypothetical protein
LPLQHRSPRPPASAPRPRSSICQFAAVSIACLLVTPARAQQAPRADRPPPPRAAPPSSDATPPPQTGAAPAPTPAAGAAPAGAPAEAVVPSSPVRVPRIEAGRGSELPMIGVVVGGGLVALGLGTGVVSGILLAEEPRRDGRCADARCAAERRDAIASEEALVAAHYAGWGVMTTGIVLGAALILAGTASDARTRSSASVAVVPRGFPGGGGVGMSGRF